MATKQVNGVTMFTNILIPMDLEHAEMYELTVNAAKQLLAGSVGKIHTLYVDQTKIHNASFTLANTNTAQQIKQETKQRVREIFHSTVPEELQGSCRIREGVVYDEILAQADEVKPDVILVASGRPGFSSYLIGSNAEKVLRHAQCSVFVIRDSKAW